METQKEKVTTPEQQEAKELATLEKEIVGMYQPDADPSDKEEGSPDEGMTDGEALEEGATEEDYYEDGEYYEDEDADGVEKEAEQDTQEKKKLAGKFDTVEDLVKSYTELENKHSSDMSRLSETEKRLEALYQRFGVDTSITPELGMATQQYQQQKEVGIQQLRQYYQNAVAQGQMSPEEANYYLSKDEDRLIQHIDTQAQYEYKKTNHSILKSIEEAHGDALSVPHIQEAARYFVGKVISNNEIVDKEATVKLIEYGKNLIEYGKELARKEAGVKQKTKEGNKSLHKRLNTRAGKEGKRLPSSRVPLASNLSAADMDNMNERDFARLVALEGKRRMQNPS